MFLLPIGLALSAFAPWLIPPLLMLGGAYLCFEGAEKIAHALHAKDDHDPGPDGSHDIGDPAHLEEEKVKGAIKTDFILSAEIMTISLAAIPESSFAMEAATLAAVAVMITLAVYGSVALIVKMDDIGLWVAQNGRLGLTRAVGRAIVRAMPGLLKALTIIGTAAMLWVGGNIIVHGLAVLGWHLPEDFIHSIAVAVSGGSGFGEWAATATMDGILGLALGIVLIPIGTRIIGPVWRAVMPEGL